MFIEKLLKHTNRKLKMQDMEHRTFIQHSVLLSITLACKTGIMCVLIFITYPCVPLVPDWDQ